MTKTKKRNYQHTQLIHLYKILTLPNFNNKKPIFLHLTLSQTKKRFSSLSHFQQYFRKNQASLINNNKQHLIVKFYYVNLLFCHQVAILLVNKEFFTLLVASLRMLNNKTVMYLNLDYWRKIYLVKQLNKNSFPTKKIRIITNKSNKKDQISLSMMFKLPITDFQKNLIKNQMINSQYQKIYQNIISQSKLKK